MVARQGQGQQVGQLMQVLLALLEELRYVCNATVLCGPGKKISAAMGGVADGEVAVRMRPSCSSWSMQYASSGKGMFAGRGAAVRVHTAGVAARMV